MKKEPAILVTMITAALNVAVVFGLGLTAAQAAALTALLAPLAALFLRRRVSPAPRKAKG